MAKLFELEQTCGVMVLREFTKRKTLVNCESASMFIIKLIQCTITLIQQFWPLIVFHEAHDLL